jgi:predicted transcriptional regulator
VTDRIDGERLAGAWSIAMGLREQIAATAMSIAQTEDWVADTLDHLARVRPRDAERLRARAAHARLFAARERAQAAIYRSCPGMADRPSAR